MKEYKKPDIAKEKPSQEQSYTACTCSGSTTHAV